MSHSAAQHISTAISIVTSTTPVLFAQPQPSGIASKGINEDQAVSLASGTADAATSDASTISLAAPAWTVSAYVGHVVLITSGALIGQTRIITANTNQALTVDIAFSAQTDNMKFQILKPSTALPVVRGWSLEHTAVAGTMRMQSKGIVGTTLTTRNLISFVNTATSGSQVVTAGSFLGLPGGDLRAVCSAASSCIATCDAYWIGHATTGVIDS